MQEGEAHGLQGQLSEDPQTCSGILGNPGGVGPGKMPRDWSEGMSLAESGGHDVLFPEDINIAFI